MAMVWLLAVTMAALPFLFVQHVHRLPQAPACPQCRTVTAQHAVDSPWDRLYALLAATPVRRCIRCGWAGRMRWRLATQRARRPESA